MIVRLLLVVVLAFLAPAMGSAAPSDWLASVRATPAGGRVVGNPAARVRLIAFATYTCPHCAHFAAEGSAPLASAIRAGRLSVEYRPVVFDQIGLAATIVARCAPISRFWRVNETLYARQADWYRTARAVADENAGAPAGPAMIDRLRDIAIRGGIAATAGLSEGQAKACFASRPLVEGTLRAADAAGAIASSTPTFMIGTQKYEGLDWAALSTRLREAGLK